MVYKISFSFTFGGGIDGKTYSNSLEAWNLSYEKGNRVFDADLMLTTDNKLVLRHENNDNLELNDTIISDSKIVITDTGNIERIIKNYPLSYSDFMKSKIYNKYTPMSLEDMIEFMYKHKDIYVAIDVKNNFELAYKYLYNYIIEKNIDEVLDRIIVSIYDDKSYKISKSIYNFKNYAIRQYANSPHNYYELAKYCIDNNIHVVNVTKKYITSDEIKILESKGIHVYVAVIDYISDLKYYKDKGASGVISNWLYEEDWKI